MRIVLLALTIVLSMFPVILAGIPSDNEYLFAKVILWLGDVPALALAVLAVPLVVRTLRARSVITVLWAALIGVEILAFAVHPSAEGVQTLLRLCTALAIMAAVAALSTDRERRLIVAVVAAVAILQTVIGILQVIHGAPIGLDMLGETKDPLVTAGNVGGVVAPEGTVLHPHILASLALLAATIVTAELIRSGPPLPWSVAAGLALVPAGITYSRAALAGVALAIAALLRGASQRGPRYGIAALTLAIGFGVPALIGIAGWTTRAEVGLDVSRRDELISQTVVLIREHPLTGVGPGRQLIALRELAAREPGAVTYLNAVHDVPLTIAVEAGIPGLIVSVLVAGAVGYRALRLTHQHGLVLTALWLGFITLAADRAAA
jgi:hypothetical protein